MLLFNRLYLESHETDKIICAVITKCFSTGEYNILVKAEDIIGTTGCLTLWTRCHINRRRYKRGRKHCNVTPLRHLY
jgi:hypothetical protein